MNYTDSMPMTGDEMRRLRKRLKLTQKQLAERLGVAENTVARWERAELGISEPVARLTRTVAGARTPGKKK